MTNKLNILRKERRRPAVLLTHVQKLLMVEKLITGHNAVTSGHLQNCSDYFPDPFLPGNCSTTLFFFVISWQSQVSQRNKKQKEEFNAMNENLSTNCSNKPPTD